MTSGHSSPRRRLALVACIAVVAIGMTTTSATATPITLPNPIPSPTIPFIVTPSWTSVTPFFAAVGGTVTFSGSCGTNSGPSSWNVLAMNLGGGGLYTNQGIVASGSFTPGSANTFNGTFVIPDAAHTIHMPYYLHLIAMCFWPVPPYTANTPTGWYALGTTQALVDVGGTKFNWQSQLAYLATFGFGQVGSLLDVNQQVLLGSFTPASPTATTTTKPLPTTSTTSTTHAVTTTTCSATNHRLKKC